MNATHITVLALDLEPDVRVRIRAPRILTSDEWGHVIAACQVQQRAAYDSTRERMTRAAFAEAKSVLDPLPPEERKAVLREVGEELGIIEPEKARTP